jgi:hypothetical protein
MIPLFDSESFAFIGSADGELIVNCRKCRCEAEAQLNIIKVALAVTCRFCGTNAEFKFRPSVRIAPRLPTRRQSIEACIGVEDNSLLTSAIRGV